MSIIELLKQRRVWAGIVGVLAFLASALKFGLEIDVPVLTELLTELGGAIASLVTAGLALWSYFKPKK